MLKEPDKSHESVTRQEPDFSYQLYANKMRVQASLTSASYPEALLDEYLTKAVLFFNRKCIVRFEFHVVYVLSSTGLMIVNITSH
jgi:hypothetical protein